MNDKIPMQIVRLISEFSRSLEDEFHKYEDTKTCHPLILKIVTDEIFLTRELAREIARIESERNLQC